MLRSISLTSTVGLALTAIALTPSSFAQSPRNINHGILACLHEASIDPNDASSLVAAVWGNNALVGGCAARVLSGYPSSPVIDQALLAGARSQDFRLAGPAASALVMHHNFDWADDMARRFPDIQDPLVRVRIAGLLAKAGRFDGWDYIRSTIVTKQQREVLALEAIDVVPYFGGMKDANGQPINLEIELDKMHTAAPDEVKPEIRNEMLRVAPNRPQHTGDSRILY